MWYFSYGANMETRILVERRGVPPLLSERAKLESYNLVFEQSGIPFIEPVFATIVPSQCDSVFGVLHRIPDEHVDDIDRFEGPAFERVETMVDGSRTGKVAAWAYWTRTATLGLKPSRRYLALLIEGAREFDLPEEYVACLENYETCADIPLLSSLIPKLFQQGKTAVRRNIFAKKAAYFLLKILAKRPYR